jgi:HAD superfamily hydrolase (TIGR01509 family)
MTHPEAAGHLPGQTPSSNRIEAVAFDLDGLLVNTEQLYQHVGAELLRRRGRSFEPDLLDAMMGRPQQVSLAIMIEWHGLTDTVDTLAAETHEIFRGLLDTELRTMPGVVELLDLLDERGIARGVATSSGPDFAHDVLGRVGLRERFAFVLTSADVTHGKPHPEVYRAAAGRLAVAPGAMLVLEDSAAGCRAAVAAGAVAVAVPGGHSQRHDFTGARFIADTLADPRIRGLLVG